MDKIIQREVPENQSLQPGKKTGFLWASTIREALSKSLEMENKRETDDDSFF